MRLKLAIVGVVLLVLLAGCTTAFNADPAEVEQSVVEQQNYEQVEQDVIEFNETIKITTFEQDVSFSSWITEYEKRDTSNSDLYSDDYAPINYVAISTPSMEIGGVEFNPLDTMADNSSVDVLELFNEERTNNETDDDYRDARTNSEDFEIHDRVDEIELNHSQEDTNITVFKYNATFYDDEMGAQFDGFIYTSTLEKDDSYIVMVGGFPEMFDEEEAMFELMKNTS